MSNQKDSIAIILSNRYYLYKLLHRVFADEPNLELVEVLTAEHTKDSLQLVLEDDDQRFSSHYELFERLQAAISKDAEDVLDKLKSEYTKLLIGPGKLPAPPWESVYITKENTLFQESTLQVRRTYLEYNFLPANYPREADDHLALELDFMAHLSELANTSFEEDKLEDTKKVLLDQQRFLKEHLMVWIGEFAEKIQESKTHYLYPQMAKLTEQALQLDEFVLEEVLKSLVD
ncbi:MAG: molecular chaperone TorD family protein [Bacillota bacterium]